MDRRGFLKRSGALAVSSAFPLPAPEAPLTFKGVRLVSYDPYACTNLYWHGDGFVVASDTFMEEMRRQWALLERSA